MAGPATSIHVEQDWLSSRVVWPAPDMTPVALAPGWKWRLQRRLDLYDGTAGDRIDAIVGVANVVQGLATLIKGDAGHTILPITGNSVADLMPWEALERNFVDQSLSYHPVRADGMIRAIPADRDGPLRVALLVGHEGPSKAFVRNDELTRLKEAFNTYLQRSGCVVEADTISTLDLAAVVSEADRRAFFAAADPHVVLYFGHGRADGAPALRVGPATSDWLPLRQLAEYAVNDHPFPASWVFIACSIGEAPSAETGPAGPEAFRILATRGARAMFAMRARVRPQIARIMANSLIESLSAGTPLELAAATARKTARRARENANITLVDWAAPAVWSTVVGPTVPGSSKVPAEFVATKLTRAGAGDLGIGLGTPDVSDAETAKRWMQERRVRLDVSSEDLASIVARLGKIAGAIGAISGRPSLFVSVQGSAPFVERLARWAGLVLPALNLSERQTPLGRALSQLKERNLEGLESLLGIPRIVVIFSSPPNASDAAAWTALEGTAADTTVILGYLSLNQGHRPGWSPDQIEAEGGMQDTLEMLGRSPGNMAILAILDGPINLAALPAITGEASADIATASLTVSMPSGVVLTASARKTLRANLAESAIIQAHQRVFEARQRRPALIESDDPFAAVRNLVGAEAIELTGFVNALAARWFGIWTEADWLRLAQALEPARSRWHNLEPNILLKVADAFVTRQTLGPARLWLDEVETDDPELDAWRQSLLSEIAKAGGDAASQKRMWQYAHGALQSLQKAHAANPADRGLYQRIRDMQANLARLELYFNHDAKAAKQIFSSMLGELNGEVEADVATPLVATLRNLAECLFEFEPFKSSPENLAEARGHLVRATSVARSHQLEALGAEALYSTAKLDESERDWPAARDHLTEAMEWARRAGHAVCLGIAQMRLFWLGVRHEAAPFDNTLFGARLRKLEFLETHAWARRYAAQSRLWAAHELDQAGDHIDMQALLMRNIASFEPSGTLSSHSDRRLVALSHAGLARCEAATEGGNSRDQESWKRFRTLAWALAWIEAQDESDPSKIWSGDS